MKKYVKASFDENYTAQDAIADINSGLWMIQNRIGELEDNFFGDDVFDDLDKAYSLIQKVQSYIDKAEAKIEKSK